MIKKFSKFNEDQDWIESSIDAPIYPEDELIIDEDEMEIELPDNDLEFEKLPEIDDLLRTEIGDGGIEDPDFDEESPEGDYLDSSIDQEVDNYRDDVIQVDKDIHEEEELPESKSNVKTFGDFINEDVINGSVIPGDDEEDPGGEEELLPWNDEEGINTHPDHSDGMTINLDFHIQPEVVEQISNLLEELNSEEDVESVITDFFRYQSGYDHDNTYSNELEAWVRDNCQ